MSPAKSRSQALPKVPDENDRLRAGTLPRDPEDDALPMAPPLEAAPSPRGKAREDAAFTAKAPRAAALLRHSLVSLEARSRQEEKPVPLPWADVAGVLGGGLWSGLYILAGGTGSGKTQWVLQTALHAAQSGHPVLYIGLEMEPVQLGARLLSLASPPPPNPAKGAGLRWSDLWQGQTRPESLALAQATLPRLEGLPLYVETAPPYGWAYTELQPRTAALARHLALEPRYRPATHPPLIILDYLQLVAGANRYESLRERIQQAVYAARAAATATGAAVLLVSATARERYAELAVARDAEASDYVGFGKESGEVEYAADAVLVLGRAKEEKPVTHAGPGKKAKAGAGPSQAVRLVVAKNRCGPTGLFDLRFDGISFAARPEGLTF